MDDSLKTLRGFVATITDPGRDLTSLGGPIMFYGLFLREILNSVRPSFQLQREITTPTALPSGDALTPWHAGACMEDRIRTAAFIRGAIRAVERSIEKSPHKPLHLVEAGCGPLGTIVLPLLAHFSSDDLVVSLIDLHEESIECMTVILDHFGFLPRVRQLVHGDAITATLDSTVDLVFTETMNTALSEEPQVAITQALMRAHRNAILIPQSIRVELALLNIIAEASQFPPQVLERDILGMVFELNRESAIELVEENGILPAATLKLPNRISPGFVPCLTTTIQVFEDIIVSDYETQISCPILLQKEGSPMLSLGDTIKFLYQMKGETGLIWNVEKD